MNQTGDETGVYQGQYEVRLGNDLYLRCKDKFVLQYCDTKFAMRFNAMRRALPNHRNASQADLTALRSECTRILKKEAAEQEWYDFEVVDGQRQVLTNEDGTPKLIPIEVSVR